MKLLLLLVAVVALTTAQLPPIPDIPELPPLEALIPQSEGTCIEIQQLVSYCGLDTTTFQYDSATFCSEECAALFEAALFNSDCFDDCNDELCYIQNELAISSFEQQVGLCECAVETQTSWDECGFNYYENGANTEDLYSLNFDNLDGQVCRPECADALSDALNCFIPPIVQLDERIGYISFDSASDPLYLQEASMTLTNMYRGQLCFEEEYEAGEIGQVVYDWEGYFDFGSGPDYMGSEGENRCFNVFSRECGNVLSLFELDAQRVFRYNYDIDLCSETCTDYLVSTIDCDCEGDELCEANYLIGLIVSVFYSTECDCVEESYVVGQKCNMDVMNNMALGSFEMDFLYAAAELCTDECAIAIGDFLDCTLPSLIELGSYAFGGVSYGSCESQECYSAAVVSQTNVERRNWCTDAGLPVDSVIEIIGDIYDGDGNIDPEYAGEGSGVCVIDSPCVDVVLVTVDGQEFVVDSQQETALCTSECHAEFFEIGYQYGPGAFCSPGCTQEQCEDFFLQQFYNSLLTIEVCECAATIAQMDQACGGTFLDFLTSQLSFDFPEEACTEECYLAMPPAAECFFPLLYASLGVPDVCFEGELCLDEIVEYSINEALFTRCNYDGIGIDFIDERYPVCGLDVCSTGEAFFSVAYVWNQPDGYDPEIVYPLPNGDILAVDFNFYADLSNICSPQCGGYLGQVFAPDGSIQAECPCEDLYDCEDYFSFLFAEAEYRRNVCGCEPYIGASLEACGGYNVFGDFMTPSATPFVVDGVNPAICSAECAYATSATVSCALPTVVDEIGLVDIACYEGINLDCYGDEIESGLNAGRDFYCASIGVAPEGRIDINLDQPQPTLEPTADPTEEPTTEAPTTEAPTTEAPTTEAPTTEAPTTEAPTTEAPTTEAPTTEAPTTEAPTTEAPTTEAPTTEAPTTEAPTTEAPTTEGPTTEAPSTEAPTTETPTTEIPSELPTTSAASTLSVSVFVSVFVAMIVAALVE